jgi:hypothetical protein
MIGHAQSNEDKPSIGLNIACLVAPVAGSFALIFVPLVISTLLTTDLNRSLGPLLMASIYGGFVLPLAMIPITLGRRKSSVSPKAQSALSSVLIGCLIDIVALIFFVWWMKVNNLGL